MPDDPAPRETARACIARLQTRIEAALAPLLDGGPVALVDHPDHGNVGDSAIWLGETAFLRVRGIRPAYASTLRSHDHGALAMALPEGAILLHGGGNFGTLWPAHQAFRIALMERFPGRPIVQMPQSIFFDDDAAIADCARAIGRHGRFTLLVRDHPSLDFARRHFPCEVILAPDMAFAIGPLDRLRPSADILCLLRTDHEKSVEGERGFMPPHAVVADWLTDDPGALRRAGLAARLRTLLDAPDAARLDRYERRAAARLWRGTGLLSTGRVVVTDRLHGHILSTLLGIPHVALDNSYGKIGSFIHAWTSGLDILRRAETLDQAEAEAATLLAAGREAA